MPSMREALEGAFDELDADVGGVDPGEAEAPDVRQEPPPAAVEETEPAQAEGERPRGPDGKFLPKTEVEEKPAAPTPRGQKAAAGQGAVGVESAAPAAPVVPPPKAPQSWNALEREAWAKGDVDGMRKAALRRESETARALQESAEARKGTDGWTNTVRPYEAQIRAAGGDPQKYVGELLQTAHALNYSDPTQKADILANLIMQFRVPPEVLDRALVARMSGQQAPQQQQQQFRDPRLDTLLQTLEQQKAQQESANAAAAEQSTNGFAETHEFFSDVAEDMADILDVWAKRGKTEVSAEDMERAYSLACQNNEVVSTALNQRKAVTSVQTAQAATAKARAAASSVRSTPTAAVAAQPAGRRAALEAAFDELDQ